ncbi:MAG: 6-bladed beta-propeller [Candidatus Saccharicenans sp.]
MKKIKVLFFILLLGLMNLSLVIRLFSGGHIYFSRSREVILNSTLIAPQPAKLLAINSLKKLQLELLLDLSRRSDVALPCVGMIDSKNEFVFFDARLRRLMSFSLDRQNIKTIGSFGEGPGEYQMVRDILVDGDRIIIVDSRNSIIEYDFQGKIQRVSKLPFTALRILGCSGDVYFIVIRSATEKGLLENEVISWQEGKEPARLLKMPLSVIRTKAYSADGKEMAGGGLIALSEPAFAIFKDELVASSGSQYAISFFDLKGREITTWKFEAPEPEYASKEFNSFKKIAAPYAIRDIFPLPYGLAIISNYFRDGQPRLDCFGQDGQLRSSWLIPLSFDPLSARLWLDNRYLVYFSSEEGCRVYKILSRL